MDILLNQMIDNWFALYAIAGLYWSLALIAAVFILMLPINYGYIKLFSKNRADGGEERLRKTLSSVSVFVVSGVLIAAFIVFVKNEALTFDIVYQGALPCGIIAMCLRAVYKIIRDIGFKSVLKALSENVKFNKQVSLFLSGSGIGKIILKYLKEKQTQIAGHIENIAEEESAVILELSEKLKGFVDNPYETAAKLASLLLDKVLDKNLAGM